MTSSPNAEFGIDMAGQPSLLDVTALPVKKAKRPEWEKLTGLRRCDVCVSEAYAASRVGIDPPHANPARWRRHNLYLCYSHAQAVRDNEAQ